MKTKRKKPRGDITYCICCGAKHENGVGWIEPHISPCANHRHGWVFVTRTVPLREPAEPLTSPSP